MVLQKSTSDQRTLTRSHIAGADFSRGKVNVTRQSRDMQSPAAVAMMPVLMFMLRTSQQWLTMLFNSTNCSFPSARVSLGQPESHPQMASQSVQSFSAGLINVSSRQTDTQTDHATPSISNYQ